ncbi:tyrosine-type recombinase/integrase [Cesiribacter sp. SM1]|uniref:tyrosine-type recombinase/integrase n=1 Tax=Cesiribacter sp. SM1 TaxID=2861196 RepID=UPI001CD3C8F1|nr:tyrosine-type recombinase/integrase [Cesiribacter sp. SM1]
MDKTKNIKRELLNISKSTGKGSIAIYYSKTKKIKRFPTGVKVDASKWDYETSQPKRNALTKADTAIVDKLYNTIHQIITDYQYKYNELPDVAHIEQFLSKPDNTENIHSLLQEFIKVKIANTVGERSAYTLIYVAKELKEAEQHYNINLTLNNLTYNFIEKYKEYCFIHKKRKLQANTLNLRLQSLKEFVKWLDKREIPHNIKPETWDGVKKNKVEPICLERDELDAILKYQPKNKKEELVKDVIVFLSHTGMRIQDVLLVNKDTCGNDTIRIKPKKTERKNITAVIPIVRNVQHILDKYNYNLKPFYYRYINEHIRKFCANIKELDKEETYNKIEGKEVEEATAKKYELLSTHDVGRKTYVNLCIQKGVPITTVMSATGHRNIDTIIQHYVDKHIAALPQLRSVFD